MWQGDRENKSGTAAQMTLAPPRDWLLTAKP
jgi:hypothetical protein